mmetsp:Transcript_131024/g.245234  ORF Transcript_131024/g.245234 Transcript_131024/m.245234 type:complete len:80 (-) Transcript_131024:45-284(-)
MAHRSMPVMKRGPTLCNGSLDVTLLHQEKSAVVRNAKTTTSQTILMAQTRPSISITGATLEQALLAQKARKGAFDECLC